MGMLLVMNNECIVIEKMFSVQNKEGVRVPFILNEAQRFFDNFDNPDGKARILVAKARQKGFSSAILAKLAVRCLGKEGTRAVCVSHESHATQKLLDKVDYYLRYIKGPKPIFGRHSRSEMFFPKMESSFYIGTAGAKAFGRGDTITDLHCSEYAFWDNPQVHFAGLFQAVPNTGRIYIESTGNGRNNDFYFLWKNADNMGYTRMFYPWYADREYSLELPIEKLRWKPDTPKYNNYLLEVQQRLIGWYKDKEIPKDLVDKQMWWYEVKLRELREDIALMQQEYPSEPEECFQSTGGSVYPNVEHTFHKAWKHTTFEGFYVMHLEGHPKSGFNYVIGGDPSGGTGNDDAAMQVFCVETFEQVFEFFNNRVNPYLYAKLICKLGELYNKAFLVIEANNHGAAVIPYVKEHYSPERLYKRKYGTATTPPSYGWNNTQITKHAIVGLSQEMLNEVTLYGSQTVIEMKSFEENEEGKMSGSSDNLVIATNLAMLGLKKFEYLRENYKKPRIEPRPKEMKKFVRTFEAILGGIKKNSGGTGHLAQVDKNYLH